MGVWFSKEKSTKDQTPKKDDKPPEVDKNPIKNEIIIQDKVTICPTEEDDIPLGEDKKRVRDDKFVDNDDIKRAKEDKFVDNDDIKCAKEDKFLEMLTIRIDGMIDSDELYDMFCDQVDIPFIESTLAYVKYLLLSFLNSKREIFAKTPFAITMDSNICENLQQYMLTIFSEEEDSGTLVHTVKTAIVKYTTIITDKCNVAQLIINILLDITYLCHDYLILKLCKKHNNIITPWDFSSDHPNFRSIFGPEFHSIPVEIMCVRYEKFWTHTDRFSEQQILGFMCGINNHKSITVDICGVPITIESFPERYHRGYEPVQRVKGDKMYYSEIWNRCIWFENLQFMKMVIIGIKHTFENPDYSIIIPTVQHYHLNTKKWHDVSIQSML